MDQAPSLSLPRLPRDRSDDYSTEIVARRRALAEGSAGIPLSHVAGSGVPLGSAQGSIESMIGFAQVPLGLAGPLLVHGAKGRRETYVPMATTEGALVASHNRGMRLVGEAGGAWSRVVREGLSQHPVLVYADAAAALRAAERARLERHRWAELVTTLTNHGRLTVVEPEVQGRRLVLRLVFTTGDAIGINMAAHAADRISAELAEASGALERYVHGQDVEKRASARTAVEGRGRSVVADVTVPAAVLREVARATPEQMASIARTYAQGFAQLGTQNWTVQGANGLAAVLLACGQDVAYLPECATGYLDMDVTADGDLYASVHLPSLLVGTVGGGCGQGTAAECLEVLGCAGDGGANDFAEVLGATVLCGDLSLMAAFCSHEFVEAHERLGRNRPAGQAAAPGAGKDRG